MTRFVARAAAAGVVLVAAVLALPSAAHAELTENTIGCKGSAVIVDSGGKQYTVSADDAEADVPREGVASWQGSITTTTHNHRGAVSLRIGFWNVNLDSWGRSANADDESSKADDFTIPGVIEQLPSGRYVLGGFHEGDEGRCAGKLTVNLQGSPVDSPVGLVALFGTVISGGLLVTAARPKYR